MSSKISNNMPVVDFYKVKSNRQKTQPRFSRKPPIEPPSFLDIMFHQRNARRSQYYFTSGHEHLGKPTNIDEEQLPFSLPPNKHLLADFHCRRTKKTLTSRKRQKFSLRSLRKPESILQKLQVEVKLEKEEAQEYKDPNKATAMTDIDPNYFKELRGRVSKGRFSIRQYVDDTREVLSTRLLIGQERDDCIRIDQQFDKEQKKLDQIKKKCLLYVKCFEEFLAEDHDESMRVLSEAAEAEKKTSAISLKRNQLSKEYGQVRLEVYFWEEAWRMVKQCQKFLYQVSPLSWREEHDWTYKEKSSSSNVTSKKSEDLFTYKSIEEAASLVSLIDMFELDIEDAKPPELYFDDPFDLIRVFRTIELQNLNALIHLESLAGPMTDMAMTITVTEKQIKSEINEISEGIKDLEDSIRGAEERAASLERYANYLLHGVFRDLVCSEQVLYLRVFIEDTYEACVAANDANLDSFTMMQSIEKTYENLNLELDRLPLEVVAICEKKGFRNEMKFMKEAEDAARKFELMHRLLAALKRIMEPPKPKKRQLMWRSAPKQRKSKPVVPLPPLTDEEQQYLDFFTNYCPQDDHNAFRSQFPDDFDLSLKNKRTENSDQIKDNKEAEECPFFS